MKDRFSLEWEVSREQQGTLLRDFLKEQEISKTALTDIKFKGGSLLVNNQEVNVRYILKAGDILTVFFPREEPGEGLKGEQIPLAILYEDEVVLVVNKPAGMSTIPSREHPAGSLANALIGYYVQTGIQATSHVVTRLDRDTSGIVLIAKNRHVHHLFSKQQKAGRVKRTYEAIAEGQISAGEGTIEEPIARKKDSIIEREVNAEGQYALTHFKVLQRFPAYTLLQLQLGTGRTHQIRVHLSWDGHPLLGDDLYGGQRTFINRQALHCSRINFYHPLLKQTLEFRANLPDDMARLI